MLKPITVRNRARGLAIGNPDRFKDCPSVYAVVSKLPHCKGPGVEIDANGRFNWLGDSRGALQLLESGLVKGAGLTREEGHTLWAFLEWKRHNAWYILDAKHPVTGRPCRSEESRIDEEETRKLESFEFNNLTVVLENGFKLDHFMHVHHGTDWFSYNVWRKYVALRDKPATVEVALDELPELELGEAPDSMVEYLGWLIMGKVKAHNPLLVNPILAKSSLNGTYKRRSAMILLGTEEDLTAAKEMFEAALKLRSKRQ